MKTSISYKLRQEDMLKSIAGLSTVRRFNINLHFPHTKIKL